MSSSLRADVATVIRLTTARTPRIVPAISPVLVAREQVRDGTREGGNPVGHHDIGVCPTMAGSSPMNRPMALAISLSERVRAERMNAAPVGGDLTGGVGEHDGLGTGLGRNGGSLGGTGVMPASDNARHAESDDRQDP